MCYQTRSDIPTQLHSFNMRWNDAEEDKSSKQRMREPLTRMGHDRMEELQRLMNEQLATHNQRYWIGIVHEIAEQPEPNQILVVTVEVRVDGSPYVKKRLLDALAEKRLSYSVTLDNGDLTYIRLDLSCY